METTCLVFNTKSWMQSTKFSNTVTFLPTMHVSLLSLIIYLTMLHYYLYNNHGIWIQKQLGLSTWFSYEALSISLFSVEYPKISQRVHRLLQIRIIVEHSSCFFLYLSSYLPQTTHFYPKTNLFHEKIVDKRTVSLQRTKCVHDCCFGCFLVKQDNVCYFVEFILLNLV